MIRRLIASIAVVLGAGLLTPHCLAQRPGSAILVEDMGKDKNQPSYRPFTISRVFDQGEFPECVQAAIRGELVITQCDVKNRWPDGSLRHAVITFPAELPAGKYMQVDFYPQACVEPFGWFSRDEVLAHFDGKWGAVLTATAKVREGAKASYTADVRKILRAWDGQESDTGVRYWLKGPWVTQMIVEDTSAALPYDFGWKNDLPSAMLGVNINATATSFKVRSESAADLATWPTPLTVCLEAEKIRICEIAGDTLTVCKDGRGAEGTRAAAHFANRAIAPDLNWLDAPEDKYRSLHPIFVVTIYRNWPGVEVDVIMENAWSTKLQDQVYNARIGMGPDGSIPAWEKNVVHVAQTRWRKTIWNGTPLPPVRIDHNLPYLIYTGVVPSYDLSVSLPHATVVREQDAFNKSDQGEVNGFAVWQPAMPTGGGRGDIGVLPRWYVAALYSSDHTLQKALFADGDVAGHVPVHIRESLDEERRFVEGGEVPARGRVISIDARPTVFTRQGLLAWSEVRPEDRLVPVGTISAGGWNVDMAHHPSMAYLPYLLSGDWYYMSEMQYWASFYLGYVNPGVCPYCRNGSAGYLFGGTEPRAEAWALRTLAQTLASMPDGAPEQAYFRNKMASNLAIREGFYDVRDGVYAGSELWKYGREQIGYGLANPLHFAELGCPTDCVDPKVVDPAQTYAAGSPWMISYLHVVNKHIEDLGIREITPQRRLIGYNLISQLQHLDFNPYLAAEYRIPIRRSSDQQIFDTWAAVRQAFVEDLRGASKIPDARMSPADHYPYLLKAAASCVVEFETPDKLSGASAYDWISRKVNQSLYALDPTWAIVPRAPRAGAVASDGTTARFTPRWYQRYPLKSSRAQVQAFAQ